MHFSTALVSAAAAASMVAAIPTTTSERAEIANMKRSYIERLSERTKLAKRQSVTTGASDAVVLNFALTLEHLEATFYAQALQNYSQQAFTSAGYQGVYSILEQVAQDEKDHVSFLTSALQAAGATPVQACNYTFGVTDVASFLATSQVLEGVGVSAYLGAAGSINNTAYLTAAGSILTVEARHNAFVRYLNERSPAPMPFDTPLSAAATVTLATPFFASCPSGSAPAIMGHPALTVSTAQPEIGQNIMIAPTNTSAVSTSNGTVYCGFAAGLNAGFSTWNNGTCQVPSQNVTAQGQIYVFLTNGPSVSDASVLAGPAAIQLGPQNYTISAKVGGNGTSGSGSSGSGSSGSGSSGSNGGSSGSNGGSTSGSTVVAASGLMGVVAGAVALLF